MGQFHTIKLIGTLNEIARFRKPKIMCFLLNAQPWLYIRVYNMKQKGDCEKEDPKRREEE